MKRKNRKIRYNVTPAMAKKIAKNFVAKIALNTISIGSAVGDVSFLSERESELVYNAITDICESMNTIEKPKGNLEEIVKYFTKYNA